MLPASVPTAMRAPAAARRTRFAWPVATILSAVARPSPLNSGKPLISSKLRSASGSPSRRSAAVGAKRPESTRSYPFTTNSVGTQRTPLSRTAATNASSTGMSNTECTRMAAPASTAARAPASSVACTATRRPARRDSSTTASSRARPAAGSSPARWMNQILMKSGRRPASRWTSARASAGEPTFTMGGSPRSSCGRATVETSGPATATRGARVVRAATSRTSKFHMGPPASTTEVTPESR